MAKITPLEEALALSEAEAQYGAYNVYNKMPMKVTRVIDGDTVEPRTGDRILEGTEVFEIQPPDENKNSVELQPGGYEWICHTKRVE